MIKCEIGNNAGTSFHFFHAEAKKYHISECNIYGKIYLIGNSSEDKATTLAIKKCNFKYSLKSYQLGISISAGYDNEDKYFKSIFIDSCLVEKNPS